MKKKNNKKEFIERCEAVLKIKKIFTLGYIPSREYQSYQTICKHTKKPFAHQINCFAHACLNLTNQQLEKLNLDHCDTYRFDIKSYRYEPPEEIEKTFPKRLKRFGLAVQPCDKNFVPQNKNQWKVALYFGFSSSCLDYDYHFLKQEKDGCWTSKVGWGCDTLEIHHSLPETYHSPSGTDYKLHQTYIITNPYAESDHQTTNNPQLQ